MASERIMIVEDNSDIRSAVSLLLETEGFQAVACPDGKSALQEMNEDIRLVVLDIMLPDIDGITVCRKIRETSSVPILFLTAKGTEIDKVTGFNAGGDDYLVKPFSYIELTARIRALLRRYEIYGNKKAQEYADRDWITISDLKISTEKNEIYQNDAPIEMTDMEYGVLKMLMQHPKQVVSIAEIYESVWGETFHYSASNTVMVHIRRIRKKIHDDEKETGHIKTVWGKGYRFE